MNRWTILKKVRTNKHRQSLVLCRCACGTEKTIIEASIKSGHSKSCGCLKREIAAKTIAAISRRQRGALNPQWKGGRFPCKGGYVMTYNPGHPRAITRNYVLEHIIIMEKILGRYLYPKETVHHKNGIRNDNRPENLELWSAQHSAGQRAVDLVRYAKAILSCYEKDIKII